MGILFHREKVFYVEENLSAQQEKEEEQTRLPRADEEGERKKGPEQAQVQEEGARLGRGLNPRS